jgi:hypothetical protein
MMKKISRDKIIMNKITKQLLITVIMSLLIVSPTIAVIPERELPIHTNRIVEVDNFKMTAFESYCYNSKMQAEYPNEPVSKYRLELLTYAFSANGRMDGLNAGMIARSRGQRCEGMTFVDTYPDWKPVN